MRHAFQHGMGQIKREAKLFREGHKGTRLQQGFITWPAHKPFQRGDMAITEPDDGLVTDQQYAVGECGPQFRFFVQKALGAGEAGQMTRPKVPSKVALFAL
jgi:hypothetical protein